MDTLTYLQGFLKTHGNPAPSSLPPDTIYWFWRSHQDTFDIASYLTVVWCESNLGTTGYSKLWNNPGNIKPSNYPGIWQQLATGSGTTPDGQSLNKYPDIYTGQRAVIRLLHDYNNNFYMQKLMNHDWRGFANVYYGKNVPGIEGYIVNLQGAHTHIVKDAAAAGFKW